MLRPKQNFNFSSVLNGHIRKKTVFTLPHKNFQEEISVNDTTGVVDMLNCNTQKVYLKDFYGLDNQPSLVEKAAGTPSFPDPEKLDLDAAHKQFKENMVEITREDQAEIAANQLYLERNQNRNLLLIDSRLLGHRVPWSKIDQIDVGLEAEIDTQVSSQSFERVQASVAREIASKAQAIRQEGALKNIRDTRSQVTENLNQMLEDEISGQQQIVDDIRFKEMDHYVHQQIDTATQKHLDRCLELIENRLNELKINTPTPKNSEIGIEPITPTANQLPQGFVYAGVVPGNGGDDIEPPGNGGNGGGGPGASGSGDDFSGDSPDSPGIGYYALMLLFWGTLLSTLKIIYSFVSSFIIDKLNFNGLNLLDISEKMFGKEQDEEVPSVQEGEAHQLEVKPPRLTSRLPSLVPLIVAGAGLVAWSYLLSPENLMRCLNLFFNLSAMLGRSFGRLLLYVIPQPLQAVAILLGNGVAQVFSFTRRVLIPAIMLSRTLMVLGLKLYVLLKLATFGVELCRLFSILSPPWLKKGVQQAVEAVESSNQIEPTSSITESPFLFGFVKSLLVFLLPFIPLAENKGLKLAGWALFMFLVNRDTVYTTVLVDKLLEYPSVVKLLSCVLGRFACIFITINLSKELKEKDSKFIIWLFYGSLYYYKVFGLALRASSNLLPV
uniref:Uncharacterized protein n=1 Tax=Caulerpa cupressoides TaxID=148945 RepID=A0A3G2SDE0_9CHLO|nr:hypothetical protein [Caulerpa cupressoides]